MRRTAHSARTMAVDMSTPPSPSGSTRPVLAASQRCRYVANAATGFTGLRTGCNRTMPAGTPPEPHRHHSVTPRGRRRIGSAQFSGNLAAHHDPAGRLRAAALVLHGHGDHRVVGEFDTGPQHDTLGAVVQVER